MKFSVQFPFLFFSRAASCFCVCACSLLLFSFPCHGTSIFEYSNGYGTSNLDNAGGLNGGEGWGSAWTAPSGGTSNLVGYTDNLNIFFSNANYAAGDNFTTTADGRMTASSGDSASNILTRSFDSALTGTVWISMLVRHSSDQNGDGLLWLDTATSGSDANSFVGLRSGDAVGLRYNGAESSGVELVSAGENLLYLAKVQIDYSGTFDSIDFWVKDENADLSSEAALGTAMLSGRGENVFGTSISMVGISGGSGGVYGFDSLRISNDANALDVVLTGVPEPSAFALLSGIGVFCAVILRRRRSFRDWHSL